MNTYNRTVHCFYVQLHIVATWYRSKLGNQEFVKLFDAIARSTLEEKVAEIGTCATTKNRLFPCKTTSFITYLPLPQCLQLEPAGLAHPISHLFLSLLVQTARLRTSQRCAILTAKLLAQELNIQILQPLLHDLVGVPTRNPSQILALKQLRTLHNQVDKGPDPRGRKRALTRSDTAAIADYLDDSHTSLDKKGAPWLDIAVQASIDLPQTTHFDPLGLRTIDTQRLQRACKEDEGIINSVCDEEKELTERQATARTNWIDIQLPIHSHSIDWKDIAFCDEFHFGVGPQVTKRIKRGRELFIDTSLRTYIIRRLQQRIQRRRHGRRST
jgi:hypothetical protein